MDKKDQGKNWSWLPAQMPGVARQIAEHRTKFGSDHVNLCWRRGVVEKQPGWFFAREGALAVGTPWDDPELANFAAAQVTATQSLVMMRPPETAHAG